MHINRYNYEEFFLLYTDNELSVAERQAVQQFIEENPDLAKELSALQQATLRPDKNVSFDKKQSLLQFTADEHTLSLKNYTEFFTQYADNELSTIEKASVEAFVRDHPQVQQEFELLQKVKLTPDRDTLFPQKRDYTGRKEMQSRY